MQAQIEEAKQTAYRAEDAAFRAEERYSSTPMAEETTRLTAYKELRLAWATANERWAVYWKLRKQDPSEKNPSWAAHNERVLTAAVSEERKKVEAL